MVRTLMQTYPTIRKNLLDPFKPDVFVHTYDKMGLRSEKDLDVSETWLNGILRPVVSKIVPFAENNTRFARERDRLYALPGPVGPGGEARELVWTLRNVLSQLWHVQEADVLRQEYEQQQGFEYDLVIRARMDSLFICPPDPLGQHGLSSYPKETIFVPDHAAFCGLCDQFAMGERESMRVHCEYYSRVQEVFTSRPLFPKGYGCAEGMLRRYHEKVTSIQAVAFRFPFEIQRETEVTNQSHLTDSHYCEYLAREAA
jgi:hypothetical protein